MMTEEQIITILLNEESRLPADEELVAFGGYLTPAIILAAYRQGIFPWPSSSEQPINWVSLNPRLVLYPHNLHISKTMQKLLKKAEWQVRLDSNFEELINLCAQQNRKGQAGTWITQDIIKAYSQLHKLGYAHSVECYCADKLIGGFYGLSIGRVFFGESMLSLVPNASKFALIKFVNYFKEQGLAFIDCQQVTGHLQSLGGTVMERPLFKAELSKALNQTNWQGQWDKLFTAVL
ncbi:MAG: leucyl/phenylalanyl-tRNA--protein transferase [Spirochaetaceae bacterium]|nr:leucyl/phenylalanyl-tRNA--protein transferase [Spirochaetaceae bacterium]